MLQVKIPTDLEISGNVEPYVREGDRVIVHSMDPFCAKLKDLVTEVKINWSIRGIAIRFVKKKITTYDQSTPMDNLMLQLMGALHSLNVDHFRAAKGRNKTLASAQEVQRSGA